MLLLLHRDYGQIPDVRKGIEAERSSLVLALHMSGEDEWQNGRGAVDPSWQHFKTRQFAERKGLKDSFGGFVLLFSIG
ncbi:hypothetical protein SUGI_0384740 [Cryptomeria japonica]|nr:hypothetical protein SUGI_0384740 [Cryptomeria japonica]